MACKQAPLPIDFIIVGAGITGLATALRLRQSGHRVTVVDKGTGPREKRKGSAHLPPNLTKLLCEWGFQSHLKRHALSIRASEFRSLDDGHVIGCLEWREEVLRESGADYLVMQYQDLAQILFDAAKNIGVNFHFRLAVTSVQPDPRRPHIILSNGRTMAAHVIIGADGPRSIVRESVSGPVEETPEGHNVYVASIPRDRLKDDPELYEITAYKTDFSNYTVWLGNNSHVALIRTDQGKTCSIHAFIPEVEAEGHLDQNISFDGATVPVNTIKLRCEPKLRRLLDRAPTYTRKRFYYRNFAEDWVDEYGRLVVVGEAAYPVWPYCIQSCSVTIEDAGVLSTLFTYLKSEDQIPYLAQAFHEIREPRVYSMYTKETKAFSNSFWVPPGPAREARDAALKMMMFEGHKGWDETRLRWQWDEIWEVFAYHAREAAEDWWVMWGILRERSQRMNMNGSLNGFRCVG